MADDDLDDDFVPEDIEEDLDEEALEEEDLDEELVTDDVLVADDDELEEEETAEVIAARAKKKRDEEDDDDDEVDPDDVEADLDTILKDRIAAADEEEDDELEEEAPRPAPDAPDGVVPKRANEFTCTGCFLLVNRGQFGPENDMRCPVGEADCPAIAVLQEPAKPVTKVAKSAKTPAKSGGRATKRK